MNSRLSSKQHNRQLATAFRPLIVAPASSPTALIDRFFRKQLIGLLSRLKGGEILLTDPLGELRFGTQDSDLKCHININDLATYRKIALGGSNGSAEAYLQSLWSCDHPTTLIRILVRNREVLASMESGLAKLAQSGLRIWHSFNHNSKAGSRKNIASHYDLGNDFFRLFLDQEMMYSSALYTEADDLESASQRKLQRICDQLKLNEADHILEIGSGWGGFACYAARTTGCRVTSITISREQFEEAQRQVLQQGLEQLVCIKLQDYRDAAKQHQVFDKVVSIEMIEAVGHQYLDGYFDIIQQVLKPGGKALIQAIVIDDGQYQRALKEVDYIKRYIFPGSFIPCYSVIGSSAAKNHLMLENLYDMGLSYAQTLRDWRQRFYSNLDTIAQQGYDERFRRMWEFYLCYCEGGFEERAISVGQLLFRKQAHDMSIHSN